MARGIGWLTLILGILTLVFPWVTTGSLFQWAETILGILVAIVGITILAGK